MLDIDEVVNATTASLKVEVPGGALRVEYRVLEFTPALTESEGSIADALCKLLTSWDLTRKGVPVPITPTGLETVPYAIQRAIYRSIFGDHSPNLVATTATANG